MSLTIEELKKLEMVEFEIARLSPVIQLKMDRIKQIKVSLSDAKEDMSAGDKGIRRKARDTITQLRIELDKLELEKNKLKDDRYAMFAEQSALKVKADNEQLKEIHARRFTKPEDVQTKQSQ